MLEEFQHLKDNIESKKDTVGFLKKKSDYKEEEEKIKT